MTETEGIRELAVEVSPREATSDEMLSRIHLAEPRDTAQVWFNDGRVFEGPVGTPLEAFVRAAGSDPEAPTV
ncbi:MAG: hypothetical protein EHM56_10075, partial [Chloroflexi bacterium]